MDEWIVNLSAVQGGVYQPPPEDEIFLRFLEADVLNLNDMEKARATMYGCATVLSPVSNRCFPSSEWDDFARFAASAGKDTLMFFGAREFVVLEYKDRDKPSMYIFRLKENGGLVLKLFGKKNEPHITSQCVADVLLAEWKYMRAKWNLARKVLVDAIVREVQSAREQAIHEFDRASAVDEYGTKVQEASYIVVPNPSKGPKAILVFPGSVFSSKKVILSGVINTQRAEHLNLGREGDASAKSVTDMLSFLLGNSGDLSHYHKQVLLHDAKTGNTVFFTPLSFCPDQLPEGGLEV